MTKIYRYCFNNEETSIIDYLRQQKISCERTEIVTTFELYDNNNYFNSVYNYLVEHNKEPISVEASFSSKELNDAEWLSVRSIWRYGHPQPQDGMKYRTTTYDISSFCEVCGNGLVQRESFVLKKEPNWKKRNYFMTNWVHDELFMSDKAMSILIGSEVNGFDYRDVLNPSGTTLENVKQVFISNYLRKGLHNNSIKKEISCAKCNSKKFLLNPGFIEYDKEAFTDVYFDIVKSTEKFGEITCSNLIFVTQKLFKIICEQNLDRDLLFTPVKLY